MKANMNNPIIPHASTSMERDEYKLQSFINSLSKRMIVAQAKIEPKKRVYHIHNNDLWIIPA
jgi:hypothetical protein